jgi:hypothetical protein
MDFIFVLRFPRTAAPNVWDFRGSPEFAKIFRVTFTPCIFAAQNDAVRLAGKKRGKEQENSGRCLMFSL